ncbi:MAG: DUF4271 domain-containing protein [Prevotella sp.]|nr:DUF4271 domain-containing protein [Prevotella sp.]
MLIVIVAMAQSRDFIRREFRLIFRSARGIHDFYTETATEVRFQFFLGFQTCLMLALTTFLLSTHYLPGKTTATAQHNFILLLIVCYILYFITKWILQSIVGWVYFEPAENRQWEKTQLFLIGIEGLPMLPIVLMLCYFDMTFVAAIFLTVMVLIFIKILTFYRCYRIFFSKNRPRLQIFLYFCTLEIVPVAALYGVIMQVINTLRV